MNHNIAQTLPDIAAQFPDRPGLIVKNGQQYRSWTFRELNCLADWFAGQLSARGVKRGDRVILMVRPSVEFITLTFALFKIGAVIILIDPGMGYKNLLKCIGRVKPDVFIGILKAHIFKTLFSGPFRTIRTSICIGPSCGCFGRFLSAEKAVKSSSFGKEFPAAFMNRDDPAAILFTTGSTGPPKGVRYEHGVFLAQLGLIRDYYRIGHEDIDQPAFPLFALFSTALGACSVIPEMNPARPAQVDPAKFIRTIVDKKVTYSFGSPAIWNVVSSYCLKENISLTSLKKILMAGAPVPGDLLERTFAILPEEAEIYTPYGATESLPIASITGREILAETWAETRKGRGVCVGRTLPGIDIRIIKTIDAPVARWDESLLLSMGEIGEIIVRGAVVTRAYDNDDRENGLAKIRDGNRFWHRMGDLGYFDSKARLWFCGRKGHRVVTRSGTMYTVCCEAVFNEHPQVFRSALVGIGSQEDRVPVLIVERHDGGTSRDIIPDLQRMARKNQLTANIEHFLVHQSFPVDIRHNAKIFREKLADWAAGELKYLT